MKTSLTWLNEYLEESVAVDEQSAADLAERIERTSVEVDSVTTLAGKQDGLVVAQVKTVAPHPDSDHMVITQVDIGQDELIQVVTGAPNVAEGQYVILAQVGSHIIDHNTGDMIEIKQATLRGETSFGMLVALQEIGFDNKIAPKDFDAGIYVFGEEDNVHAGDDAIAILGMNEPVIDTDLTPNRSDMLSMLGTAYEFGAMLGIKVVIPDFDLVEYEPLAADQIQISVESDELASKYAVRVINNITVKDSPLWLQKRLWNAGMRPINNVVDITNYMMLVYGQPLHAFDLDKLTTKQLAVRRAKNNEQLTTLDGQTRQLRAGEDIVIATTDAQPLMLAGVMGGMSSEVDRSTKNIVIESAVFNPSLVRATARRHNIHSEASSRFERGVNSDHTFTALDHAASLVDTLATGQVARGLLTAVNQPREAIQQAITVNRVNHILGTTLTLADVTTILDRLAFEYTIVDSKINVVLPARRPDMSIEADLIEEIARLYGYDNLPVTLPYGPTTPGSLTKAQRQIRASRKILESLGMNQAISYALTTPEKAQQFAENPAAKVVTLDYPMSSDRTTVRQNLLAGLLEDVAYNVNHSVRDIALYEQGRVFVANGKNELPTEIEHLAGVLTGNIVESSWQQEKAERIVDFYDIKGIVVAYLEQIGVKNVRYVATDRHANMHPGRTADIYTDDVYLGFVGQIHPKMTRAKKMTPVYGFELNLFTVMSAAKRTVSYQPVTRFPQVSRDVALLINDTITNEQVMTVIHQAAGSKLADVTLFDVYAGDKLPTGKKSLAYQLTYQNNEGTLVESEVNDDFEVVTKALVAELGADIR